MKLGDLAGNRFKILIREVSLNASSIENCVNSLKQTGFVNYFGLQRFGNSIDAPTHAIGRLLIQNKLKEAIDLILKPRKGSPFEREQVTI